MLTHVWGAKLKVSPRLSPRRIWTATFFEEDVASIILLNSLLCRRQDDRVGMPSESSHIATGPLQRKLLFQLRSARKLACSILTPKCVIRCFRVNVL